MYPRDLRKSSVDKYNYWSSWVNPYIDSFSCSLKEEGKSYQLVDIAAMSLIVPGSYVLNLGSA